MQAQTAATLVGQVEDSSHAALPGASVVLRSDQLSNPISQVTDSAGKFRVERLAPGKYRVTVQSTGLAEKTQEITLTAGQILQFPVTLQPPNVAESVEVVGNVGDVAATATKTDTPLIETPQSISVITRERLTEQNPPTMQDALRYVAGVRSDPYGPDNRGDWAMMRGGEDWGQYLNGLKMLFDYNNTVRPEPFALERIDVMRGPSSVMYGQGGFGGVVNLVSKRPLPVQRREVQMQFGTFGRKQVAADFTGAIDRDEKWLYRLVALGRASGTQVDHVPDDRLLLMPSVTWRPGSSTSLTVLSNFQQDNSASSVGFFPWEGTLLPHPQGQIPTNTFISEPAFDEYRANQKSIGYFLEHRFADKWTLRQNMNYSSSDVSYQSIYTAFDPRPTFNLDGRTVNRTVWVKKAEASIPTVDTHLQLRQRTGPLQHVVLGGVDFQKATITGFTGGGSAPAIDVYNPVYGNYTPPTLTGLPKSRQDQTGIYVQDQVKIYEHLVALLGIRKDWAHAETEGSPDSNLDSQAVTGRAGLVYLFNNGLAPYASYSESFLPLSGVDVFNRPYKPQRAKQSEVGIKYQPVGRSGMVSLALYDMRQINRKTPDPNNPLNSLQVGEARIRGVELEASTNIFWKLNVLASYAFTDARISRSTSEDMGKRLPTMPRNMASLWATRRFSIGDLHGFQAGGGIRYTGSSFDGMDILRTPVYTLYDAMFAYDAKSWRLAVNASNLADKVHVTTCLARGDCFYGLRRTVIATVGYRF